MLLDILVTYVRTSRSTSCSTPQPRKFVDRWPRTQWNVYLIVTAKRSVLLLTVDVSARLDVHDSAIIVLGSGLYDCVGNIDVRDTEDSATGAK